MAQGDEVLCDFTGWESGDAQESAWPPVWKLASSPTPDDIRLLVVQDADAANAGNYYAKCELDTYRCGGVFGNEGVADGSGFVFGCAFRVADLSPGGIRPVASVQTQSNSVDCCPAVVYVGADGKLYLGTDTGLSTIGLAGTISAGTWYYLEISYGGSASGPTWSFHVHLDGVFKGSRTTQFEVFRFLYGLVGAAIQGFTQAPDGHAGVTFLPYETWYDDLYTLGREASALYGVGDQHPTPTGGLAVGAPQDPDGWISNPSPSMSGDPGTDCDEWPGANDGWSSTLYMGSSSSVNREISHLSSVGSIPAGVTVKGGGFYGLFLGCAGVATQLIERGDAPGHWISRGGGDTGITFWYRFQAALRFDDGADFTEGAFDVYDALLVPGANCSITTLLFGLCYLRAAAGAGGGGGSGPIAPSGLYVVPVDDDTLEVNWSDNSVDETSFRVERSDDGVSGWAEVGSTAADTTSYPDNGLSAGTTYYYRVRARNGAGDSAYSNIANGTTTGGGMAAPAAPSDLTATALSSSRIRLTWRDNASDETGFKVERSPNGTTGWVEVGRVEDNVGFFVNTGLSAATTYYYRVRAFNTDGDSANSNTASATTLASGVGGCAVTPYASVEDVQARIWTDLLPIRDDSQPSTADVEDWLCQESHWIDSSFAWRYVMPATDPTDRERLRLACADLVAARAWRVLVPRNPGQESRPDELKVQALTTLVFQPGAVRPVGASLGRLATDPPREGRSFLALPGTALADSGEAELGAPEGTFTDPDAGGEPERMFSVGMDL